MGGERYVLSHQPVPAELRICGLRGEFRGAQRGGGLGSSRQRPRAADPGACIPPPAADLPASPFPPLLCSAVVVLVMRLILSGLSDPRVLPQHAACMLRACLRVDL